VACVADPVTSGSVAGCADALGAIDIGRAAYLPPAANLAFRQQVTAVVARLDAGRHAGRAALVRAHHRRGQAKAAVRLQHAYAAARLALVPVAPHGQGAASRAFTALRHAARDYGRLAAAAHRARRHDYAAARHAIARDEATLARALRGLAPIARPAAS
jgi:hypothetical protein